MKEELKDSKGDTGRTRTTFLDTDEIFSQSYKETKQEGWFGVASKEGQLE